MGKKAGCSWSLEMLGLLAEENSKSLLKHKMMRIVASRLEANSHPTTV